MSAAQPLSIRLEEGERLKRLGIDSEICEDIDAALQIRQEHKRLREVILEILDDGDGELTALAQGNRISWAFDHPFEDVANSARLRFADAVIEKLR